ncbi:MAG: hypothetical protein ACJAUJ_000613 [Salibacteraceae bacterium]|jgi:hypothetical protein
MRKVATLLFIVLSQFSFAQIDTLTLRSKISDVTVFFSGAQVTRTGKVTSPVGKSILILDELPVSLNTESIQVSGFETSTILSVKSEIKYYNSTQKSDQTKQIEIDVKELKVSANRLYNSYDVLKIEESILLNNSQFAGKEKSVSIDELKLASDFYRKRLTEIRNGVIDIQIAQEKITDEIKSKYVALNKSVSKKKSAYKQVYIAVKSKTSQQESFDIKYYAPTAGWTPSYDFRVEDTESPLKIIYNSNVFQSTGENWNKVDITLSTNNPGISGVKPELRKWIIGRTNTYTNSSHWEVEENLNYSFGAIEGIVSSNLNEPVPFANIALLKNDNQVLSTTTDFDGRYTLKPMPPGTYTLRASYIGFSEEFFYSVRVDNNSRLSRNFVLNSQGISERDQISQMAVRSIADISKAAGSGIASRDDGSGETFGRGQRSGSSVTFIDGVKVIGSTNLPKSTIEEVSINTNNYYENDSYYPNYREAMTRVKSGYNHSKISPSARYGETEEVNTMIDVSRSNLSLEYKINIPYTIPSDGKEYNLKIKETDIVAEYEYYIVPKIDKDAFLVANIINWEDLNLISGKSNLYYQGTFIGESFINADQSEDTMSISLGREKSIYISRELNKEVEERQLYTSSIKEYIGWDLVVKNAKNETVKINIEDQYPTSERKSVIVDLTDYEGAIVNEKTGKLSWSFTLNPGEKKELAFKYNIKYPKFSNFEVR